MEINIIDENRLNLRKNFTHDIVQEILNLLELNGEISIYYVDSQKMKNLNNQYRNKNQDTDVLSFEFKGVMPVEYDIFGDIIISTEYARKIAKEDSKIYEIEIAELLVHGVLHLAGYEHENVDEETSDLMFKTQAELLTQIQIIL